MIVHTRPSFSTLTVIASLPCISLKILTLFKKPSSVIVDWDGERAENRPAKGGERPEAGVHSGRRAEGLRNRWFGRRLIAGDSGCGWLHSSRSLFPLRVQGSDLRGGSSRLARQTWTVRQPCDLAHQGTG